MRQSTLEKIEEEYNTNYICLNGGHRNKIRFANRNCFLIDEIIFEKRNCVIKKWMFKWKVLPLFKLNFEVL
jgi:hypothetical protein